MIFVTAEGLSLDRFVDWLNAQGDEDSPRARIVVRNVVVDRRVQIMAQPEAGKFLLQADRVQDELLVAREMVLFLDAPVLVLVVEDEAHLRLVPADPAGDEVLAAQEPGPFLLQAFDRIGRSQFEEPDDFIHDQLLDWATEWLQRAGHANHLGFASFDRHRLIVHAGRRSAFRALPAVLAGEMGVSDERPFSIGLAHPAFAATLEQKAPLEDGTETFMGFVYFFDMPDWREMSMADRAEQKLGHLMSLCQPQTPWVASDIRNRTVGLAQEGGGWIDMWDWRDGKAVLSQEFFPLPRDL